MDNTQQQRSATVTSVSSLATSVTIAGENKRRKGLIIWNNSTAILYLKFGDTASTADFTERLASQTGFRAPEFYVNGRIDGIWASANGDAQVTEIF